MKKELYIRIKDYCDKTGITPLMESSRAVTVGFSGGADSVFLLSYLKETLSEEKLLCAVHLNHMLRGDEADRDEAFCARFCREKGILFISEKADVYAISKMEKQGIEECARNERYKLFDKCRKQLAKEHNFSENEILIATAHNADDSMETVIFNMARGSGAAGLCGIPPVRDGKYIRPILCVSSAEIREHLADCGEEYMLDSTNAENEYARNKIRHNVVPVLREINPSAEKAFARLSSALASDEAYFAEKVDALLEGERETGNAQLSKIKNEHPAVLKRALMRLYFEAAPDGNIGGVHLDDICSMIERGAVGELHLPSGITAIIGENISFGKRCEKTEEKTESYVRELKIGVNRFEDLGFVLGLRCIKNCSHETEKSEKSEDKSDLMDNIYNSLINICINSDKIKGTVFIRNRRASDVYFIGGHHKKVKKLFCDKKIPVYMRDVLPLVCDDEGILWIPGFPPRDGAVCRGAENSLKIYYSLEKEF